MALPGFGLADQKTLIGCDRAPINTQGEKPINDLLYNRRSLADKNLSKQGVWRGKVIKGASWRGSGSAFAQMVQVRFRELEWLTQGHPAGLGLAPTVSAPRERHLSTIPFCAEDREGQSIRTHQGCWRRQGNGFSLAPVGSFLAGSCQGHALSSLGTCQGS